MPWAEFRPTRLMAALSGAGVDYVVIGGIAAIAHGSARVTQHLDITYATEADNLDRLGKTLIGLEARLRGVEEDVPFTPDARTLKRVMLLTLDTSAGPLDLLSQPPGAPAYPLLRKEADRITVDGVAVLIASIDHLVAMKLAAGRPRDLGDIDELDAIRRRRET